MSYITSGFWRLGLALSNEPNKTGVLSEDGDRVESPKHFNKNLDNG
jgi:hypothetical protein